METQDWKALEARYYKGESSLEEEAALRAYWQRQATYPEADLASYFEAAAQMQLPAAKAATITRALAKRQRNRHLYALVAAAASWLVLLGFWGWARQGTMAGEPPLEAAFPLAENADWSRYEVDDPALAAAILSESLHAVAIGWKTGQEAALAALESSNLRRPLQP